MPSDLSAWLIAVPQDGDSEGLFQELQGKLDSARVLPKSNIAGLYIPPLKAGTLDELLNLSEGLSKTEAFFTGVVAKIVETLRNLLNNDPQRLAQHTVVDDQTPEQYLLKGWKWNTGKYTTNRKLREIIDALSKEMTSIDSVMKAKLSNYNLAKGQLVQMQRKKAGNLAVKTLHEVLTRDHFVHGSEYLETLLVAVPTNLKKDWESRYERLSPMVVPRSTKKIASDDEYTLYSVIVFKRVHDEFAQKCRENKFVLRDYSFDENALEKQRQELQTAHIVEKELWTELLRLSRTNFSEAYQALVHMKVTRLFVESVLRYGPPANFTGVIIQPDPKSTKRLVTNLQAHFAYLAPRSMAFKAKAGTGTVADTEVGGEYAALMEEEVFDFVLVEVPRVVN